MTIQQFAEQLKQEEGVTPLLRKLQALRACSLNQIKPMAQEVTGWIPWGAPSAQENVPNQLVLQS